MTSTIRVLALCLQPVAVAARAASDIDRSACQYLTDGLAALMQWDRDTTEASRRRAACAASAALALAALPTGDRGAQRSRSSLRAMAGAMTRAVERDSAGAAQAAHYARRMAEGLPA